MLTPANMVGPQNEVLESCIITCVMQSLETRTKDIVGSGFELVHGMSVAWRAVLLHANEHAPDGKAA
jgi:hypothetical protein